MRAPILLFLASVAALPAAAQYRGASEGFYTAPPPSLPPQRSDEQTRRYQAELLQLRADALSKQTADGGQLSAASLAQIEARLAAIKRRYPPSALGRSEINLLDNSWQ